MANNTISSNEASNFDFGSRLDDYFTTDWESRFDSLNDQVSRFNDRWESRLDDWESRLDSLNDSDSNEWHTEGDSSSDSDGNEIDFFISTGDIDNIVHGGDGDSNLSTGDGSDKLYGGDGNDILTGGKGADRFCFKASSAFNPADAGVDEITDFGLGADHLVLFKDMFTSLSSTPGEGFSIPSEFAVVGSDAAAGTSAADIVYNSVNGNLFYNPNGGVAGFGSGGQFATLADDPVLSSTDFVIM